MIGYIGSSYAPEVQDYVPGSQVLPGLFRPVASIPQDLIAACILWLRTNAGGIVAEQFCDTEASPKFYSDEAFDCDLPYLVFEEPNGAKQFESGGDWIEKGMVVARVYASPKTTARFLGDAVFNSLNDADLVFASGELMYFRGTEPFFQESGDVAPGSVVSEYVRIVIFNYIISGPRSPNLP